MSDPGPVTPAILAELRVQNYRQFSDLTVSFESDLSVIVATNGGGKTALLDAAAIAMRYFVETISGVATHGFEKSDVRLVQSPLGPMVPQLPTSLRASGVLDAEQVSWSRELASLEGKTTTAQAKDLRDVANHLRKTLETYATRPQQGPPNLPVMAYYGTGRLWSEGRVSDQKQKAAQNLALQLGAYVDCLRPSSSYRSFVQWFEAVVREAQNERETGAQSPYRPNALLEGVRRATDEVLEPSGWRRLDWDFLGGEVVADHQEVGRIPVSLLSDGIRNTLAMVADLAHRCVRLNPHFGAEAAVRSPGLVLIDEVDMHLHPAWQQSVLAALRRAFKNMQFIVTTHSPQVISTVPARCIRILDGAAVASAPPGTQGAESSRVLKRHAVAAVLHHDPLVLAPRVRRGAGGHRVRRVT